MTGSKPKSLSPETQLVARFARARLSSLDRQRVSGLLQDGVDWDDVVALARRHRLLPLVASHLRGYRELVPPSVQEDLSRAEHANVVWTLSRAAQLIEAIDALESVDILAVPYKGPALGAQLYGSGALRIFNDLDVVVRPRDVPEARRVLLDLGYVPRTSMTDPEMEFMLRHRYHEDLVRDDDACLELHWSFTGREIGFDLDLDEAWTRLQSIDVYGRTFSTFHPEDLLLILSVHGAKHRWDRMEWLAGLAELVRQSEGVAWDGILDRASRLGVRRALALGLYLAVDLLDAPVPSAVVRRIDSDRRLPPLVDHVMDLLDRPPSGWTLADRVRRDRFRILLQDRVRDRLRYAWNRAATPSDPDRWKVARLGPWVVPIHTFKRPYDLLRTVLKSGRASSTEAG